MFFEALFYTCDLETKIKKKTKKERKEKKRKRRRRQKKRKTQSFLYGAPVANEASSPSTFIYYFFFLFLLSLLPPTTSLCLKYHDKYPGKDGPGIDMFRNKSFIRTYINGIL